MSLTTGSNGNGIGPQTSANSSSVVIASDQIIPVSGTVAPSSRVQSTANTNASLSLTNVTPWFGTIENVEGYRSVEVSITTTQELFLDIYQYNDGGSAYVSDEVWDVPANQPFRINTTLYGKQLKLGLNNVGASTAIVTVTTYLDQSPCGFPTTAIDISTQAASGYSRIKTQADQLPSTLGQKVMASSLSVAIASNQSTIPVSLATLPSLVAGSAIIGKVGIDQTTPGTTNKVSIGTDGTVAINSALPAGSNTIGAVTQASGPWTQNITQFGSAAVVTGTGVSGSGIPRVTVSNDSAILSVQSGTWTVQQGNTPTAIANAWAVKLTDGTNTTAVKAASTAALATDPSAVVALSPNSPLPTGSNVIGALTANQSINLAQVAGTTTVTAGVNGLLAVGGNAASGATDSGNPVKVGGVFNTTLPTLTTGQRGDLQLDSRARPIIAPLTNTSVVKSQLQDNAGNGLTSSSTGVTVIQALDVNPVSVTINKYTVSINVIASANTVSGTIFTMRNAAAATKDVIIDRLFLCLNTDGAANASVPRYNIVRFSAATPTGGTAVTIAKMDNSNAASQVTDVRFLDTGLTTTGVTFETGNITSFGITAANNNTVTVDIELPIRLAAGEGLAIQILAATRTGTSINGHILWSER